MYRQIYRDGIMVDWADDEWERLQDIRQKKYDLLMNTYPIKTMDGKRPQINVTLSTRMYDRIKTKSEEFGIPAARIIRIILEEIYGNS